MLGTVPTLCYTEEFPPSRVSVPGAIAEPPSYTAQYAAIASPPLKIAHNYSSVLSQKRRSHVAFEELPGFTRSVYYQDHAVITPESRVWAGQPGW